MKTILSSQGYTKTGRGLNLAMDTNLVTLDLDKHEDHIMREEFQIWTSEEMNVLSKMFCFRAYLNL